MLFWKDCAIISKLISNQASKATPCGFAMTEFTVKLADVSVRVACRYPSTREYCRRFLTGEQPAFSVSVEETDYRFEQHWLGNRKCPDTYLEQLAVYRKICEGLLPFGVFLLHGSAVAVDGAAYIFIALSGTGKSTHTALWRSVLSERHEVVMVNDDKPLIQVTEQAVFVCGTPWNGAHHLSENVRVPVKAICVLDRAPANHIEPVDVDKAFPVFLRQSYRPSDPALLIQLLDLIGEVRHRVKFYHLDCNMEPEAAVIAYQAMKEG